MEKRILSAVELMPPLTELLENGAELPLTVSGASMLPFLYPGRDTVFLRQPSGKLKKGDVLLYRRSNGRYILHRLRRIENDGLFFAGDAQDVLEGPIAPQQVIACATRVRRKGRLIGENSPVWQFYKRIWALSFGRRKRCFAAFRRLKDIFGRSK